MTNVISKLQQKFNLFAAGDECVANVYAVTNKEPQLRLKGGAVGIITVDKNDFYQRSGIKLQVGNVVDVVVTEVVDGIPSLALSPSYILANTPQTGVCKIIGTRGVIVEFPWKEPGLGFYPMESGVPENAERLEEGTEVECLGLTPEEDYYRIKKLRVVLPEERAHPKSEEDKETKKPQTAPEEPPIREDPDFKFPQPWPEERIQKSLTSKDTIAVSDNGLYRVGHCYLAQPGASPDLVMLDDKQKAQVRNRNGINPRLGEYVLVRIIKMYTFGYIDVEFVDLPDDAYVQNFQKAFQRIKREFKIVEKNGFKFNYRDDAVFKEGMKNRSEKCFEQYWLGYLYEVSVSGGKPLFENRKVGRLDVRVLDSNFEYRDGDTLYCQLVYIEPKDKKAVLTVKIMCVIHQNVSQRV